MKYELSEIKLLRKKLDLTQGELAKRAGVSQSLIAKIEAGLLDPTYSKTQKIFDALNTLSNKNQVKINDIMVKKIVFASPDETLSRAIQKMKRYEISQMPVVESGRVMGLISESNLLDALLNSGDPNANVRDVMSDAPPVISVAADADTATHLLKFYPLVMVSDKGRLTGVVTKADLLRSMFKR